MEINLSRISKVKREIIQLKNPKTVAVVSKEKTGLIKQEKKSLLSG